MNRLTKTLATLGLVGTLAGCAGRQIQPIVKPEIMPIVAQGTPVTTQIQKPEPQYNECDKGPENDAWYMQEESVSFRKKIDSKVRKLIPYLFAYGEASIYLRNEGECEITLNGAGYEFRLDVSGADWSKLPERYKEKDWKKHIPAERVVAYRPQNQSYGLTVSDTPGQGFEFKFNKFGGNLTYATRPGCKEYVQEEKINWLDLYMINQELDGILETFVDNRVAKK